MSSCTSFNTVSPIVVTANIQRWTITSDDIYLLKFHEEPEPWLEDIILGVIDDVGLVGDIDNLTDRFDNFEEGYTAHFYDWQDGDINTLAYVENIYTSNAVYNAGIQEIKVAYVSKSESGAYFDTLIGAWQTGAGGAWFNERVSVVSNVAYAAAKSASTLTATMKSQQDQLGAIAGDIEVLEKQIDGKVETWRGFHQVVNPDGTLKEDAKPYYCWSPGILCDEAEFNDSDILDTRSEHTGDTYLHIELDANGKEVLLGVYRFGKDTDTNTYNWFVLEDDLAAVAYQNALYAGVLADGKINSYYQTTPPTSIEDPTLGEGDIWLDSNDSNKMYRYTGTDWVAVRDTDITASVDRLDQATVDVSGVATASSTLVVNADGNIAGVRISATNDSEDPGSKFRIFADEFTLAASDGQPATEAPFRVDVTNKLTYFNGKVEFNNIDGGEDILLSGDAANDINQHTTTIDGGKITTYSLNANRIAVDTLWARGMIASEEQRYNTTGYISNTDPSGFIINGKAGNGSYNYPNIYGAYIRGGYIRGTTMEAVTMKASEFLLITDAGYNTRSTVVVRQDQWLGYMGSVGGSAVMDLYPYNSPTGGTDNKQRLSKYSGTFISLNNFTDIYYSATAWTSGSTPGFIAWAKHEANDNWWNNTHIQVRMLIGSNVVAQDSFSTAETVINLKGFTFKWMKSSGVNIVYFSTPDVVTTGISGSGKINFQVYGHGYYDNVGSWQNAATPTMIVYNL